jgi:hypothetical protein
MLAHFNEYKIELFDTDTPLPGIPTITEEMKRFYLIFVYIHLYPKCRHMTAVLRIAGEPRGANKHWYDTYCRPIAWKLGEIMREVHPEDRFDHMNHCPFFSSRITEIKDSLPIRVDTSSNSMAAMLSNSLSGVLSRQSRLLILLTLASSMMAPYPSLRKVKAGIIASHGNGLWEMVHTKCCRDAL